MIVSSLFNPWINIFAKLDFIAKYISAERRRTIEATTTFNTMLDNLIDKKRQELIDAGGINNNIPENEKDLLTLMLEADIRDVESNEESTTTEELRVIIFTWHK
jgi:cytochrome P450